MHRALELAVSAAARGEVPVGAVMVKAGQIIAEGSNITEQYQDVTGHAEVVAIKAASKALGDWRLAGCELYVTLEPCTMCAGTIRQARVSAVYFGAFDEKVGAMGSLYDLGSDPRLGPAPAVVGGILSSPCSLIIKDFFSNSRKR